MTDKLKGYSTTPASNNSAAPNGWPEGMAPSDVNNCAREMMARLAEWYQDAAWVRLDESIQSSTSSTIVVSGDVTATYLAGRPIRVNQSGSQVGYVSSSVYSAPNTTINVTGFTVSSPTVVEVGILPSNALIPTGTVTAAQVFTGTVTAGVINATSVSLSAGITAASGTFSGSITAANLGALASKSTVTASDLATDDSIRDWVLARTAAAALGAVGTYAFLSGTANTRYVAGTTYAGSGLQYAGLYTSDASTPVDTKPFLSGTSPSGTWRAMGSSDEGVTSAGRNITLFLRIS